MRVDGRSGEICRVAEDEDLGLPGLQVDGDRAVGRRVADGGLLEEAQAREGAAGRRAERRAGGPASA